jgi:hypothetical protein
VITGILIGVIVFLVLLFAGQARYHHEQMERNHAKCSGMVAAFVGDKFAAVVLESAAERYDSMDGMADRERLANTVWQPHGASIPALFMRDLAAQMRAKEQTYAASDD